ncbi:MAG: universal stress protein [Bradymonadaceae bacterium]|nr:universal stress protein [Lujinxingiaceae bacterium]
MKGSKLILATDLSENAGPAARWAEQFGQRMGLDVVVVHVLDITLRSWQGAYDVLEDNKLRDKALARLADWYEKHTGVAPAEVVLEVGSPLHRLSEVCKSQGAAMLVLSMSGKGAWNKFVFGSTALKLVHSPPCPVVIVHPEHSQVEASPALVVGTDFSKTSDPALSLAGAVARKLGGRIDIVHANVLPSSTLIFDTELPEELQHTAVVDWAEASMERFVQDHVEDLSGLAFDCHVITDYPVHGLLEFVEQNGIDMLFLGHYGKDAGTMSRLSSVMIKTVQQMRSTVVIVPE